ncbi:MAG: hypothetical protein Q4D26_06320 [Clostridia bacterium]|nr:hypothetical protein [Clostridia bacterium]
MSNINYTSVLLNLKELNLDFSKNICEVKIINGIKTKIINIVNKPHFIRVKVGFIYNIMGDFPP